MLDQYGRGHIVLPTHEGIGATDFIKIRCIPVYVVGCNSEPEFADEYFNTSLEFFSHDVQHARRQLYYTEKQLYIENNKTERFAKNNVSRSVFDINNDIVLDDIDNLQIKFAEKMATFTKNIINPLLLLPKSPNLMHKQPLNNYVTTFNNNLAKGLRSMRKMILFEVLHEAALVTLPEIIINSILIDVHQTPIERVKVQEPYVDIENILYPDPSTLSNVLYKIQGTFFDTLEERAEFIVPTDYRNATIVALSALQILTELIKHVDPEKIKTINSEIDNIKNPDYMFNKLFYLTLNNKNRLQSTTKVTIEGLLTHDRVFKISDVIDSSGNLIKLKLDKVETTRTTIYEDPIFKVKNKVSFYGPTVGDQSIKVAIFGGSFDPPHNSHKLRIQQLYDANSLNKIVIAVAANNSRKPNLLPQDLRYQWTKIMIEEILTENNDHNIENFKRNPEKNTSKFELIMAEEGAGDTIMRVRKENPGCDIIFIYGSDYSLKEGNKTPLNGWDKPTGWEISNTEPNFYHGVTQIQFERSATTGNTSSTNIRAAIIKFISTFLGDSKLLNYSPKDAPREDPVFLNLKKLADSLDINIEILTSYIRYLMTSKKQKPTNNLKEDGNKRHKFSLRKFFFSKFTKNKSTKNKSTKNNSTKNNLARYY